MLPILYISRDRAQAEKYLDEVLVTHKISAHHVFRMYPVTTVISIDQIREIPLMIQRLREHGLVALFDFHTAKGETQNAFLKTLEEESDRIQFILHVHDDGGILPTIRSRTHVVYGDDMQHQPSVLLEEHGLLDEHLSLESWMSITTRISKEHAEPLMHELSAYLKKAFLQDGIPAQAYRFSQTELMNNLRTMQKNNVNFEFALDAIGGVLAQNNAIPLPRVLL